MKTGTNLLLTANTKFLLKIHVLHVSASADTTEDKGLGIPHSVDFHFHFCNNLEKQFWQPLLPNSKEKQTYIFFYF